MAETVELRVPDIGDFDSVDVIEVLIKPGDTVAVEQSLITLESDKATMEVPSSHAGTVKEVKVKPGDKISKGDLVALLETTEDAEATAAQTPVGEPTERAVPNQHASGSPTESPGPAREFAGEEEPRPQAPPPVTPEEIPETDIVRDPVAFAHKVESDHEPFAPMDIDREQHRKAHASPAVRQFARELGVDLSKVDGSGPKGRILKEDVQGFVKSALQGGAAPAATGSAGAIPAIPAVDFSKWGEVETKPLSRIKKISGPHLQRAWLNVPHVTQFDQADITELEAFRVAQKEAAEKKGVKLTLLAFLVKACAYALREFPDFNSSLSPQGDALILKKYINIGVAVDTPEGLVVPVVKDADQKGIFQIAADLAELSSKARDKKLAPADIQGGTFSISSLGGIGGTAFTPLVNAPEVAILGVSRSEMKPLWDGETFVPRLMLPLSLSYDHRVVDGAAGARFTTHLSGLLGDIRRLLL